MSNIYDVVEIENQIERIAEENQGEIPEDMISALVEAQMKSIVTITGLCKYLKSIDLFSEACKSEENRISDLRKRAEKRKESIVRYITPFVARDGRIDAGTFKLSVRTSESVELDDDFQDHNPEYTTMKMIKTSDKIAVKTDLKKGKKIYGARLVKHDNLQIK
jgi:hypothetical protein